MIYIYIYINLNNYLNYTFYLYDFVIICIFVITKILNHGSQNLNVRLLTILVMQDLSNGKIPFKNLIKKIRSCTNESKTKPGYLLDKLHGIANP